jgi:cell division protein FtsL
MMRLNLVLLLAVMVSGLYLVNVQYESRRLTAELDKANTEARRLESEKDLLQVAKRSQATPARVERLARDKLHMRQAQADITTYVTYAGSESVVAPTHKGSAP